MAERSWRGFSQQRDKYATVRSSKDYRKKKGLLDRVKGIIGRLFGA